jgi:glycosyltransferase involved in cell wall biosynthesis
MSQPRLLIISHDVIGSRMAGPGIRYWELARTLSTVCAVTLAAPAPIDRALPAVVCYSYQPGDPASLRPLLANADCVLANGVVLGGNPELAACPVPLMIDLYDPTLLENLELFRTNPAVQRIARTADDHALLTRQLAAGDAFICATERQRDLFIGALMAAGRITPERTDTDPLLRNFIDVVSFGLPAEPPPPPSAPALRGVLPGVDATSELLLWTGGLWDWMDPQTLIRAMALVAQERPQARLVFLAGKHPGPAAAMRTPDVAQALAAELGLLGSVVHFYPDWVPYAQRGDFLGEADLLVSLHHPGLESAYAAIRSRFLDHLWSGRASITSAGDAAADLIERYSLGRTVPINDVAATARAIGDLLADTAERAACAQRARELAARFTWEEVAAPIRRFCAGSGNRGAREPGSQGTGEPGNRGAREPGSQGTREPGNRGAREPGSQGTGEPGNRGTREPGSQGTGEPGNRGTGEPGNWGTGEPGNQGYIVSPLGVTLSPCHPVTPSPSHPVTVSPPHSVLNTQHSVLSTQQDPMSHDIREQIDAMERHWAVNAAPAGILERLARPLLLRLMGGMLAQQREFNGATLRALYALRERQAQADSVAEATLAQAMTLRNELTAMAGEVHKLFQAVLQAQGGVNELQIATSEARSTLGALRDELGFHSQRITDANARIDALGAFDGTLNDRLARLAHAVKLLDEAIAAADEAHATIAAQVATLQPTEARHD